MLNRLTNLKNFHHYEIDNYVDIRQARFAPVAGEGWYYDNSVSASGDAESASVLLINSEHSEFVNGGNVSSCS